MRPLNSVKSLLSEACRAVLRRCSPETRMNFCLDLIRGELARSQAGGDWPASLRLRKRLHRRFVRGWPCLSSGEMLRTYGFFDAVSTLATVPGDFVECGVGMGRTLAMLCSANAFFELGRTVYGFDSFEGFPDAAAEDVGTRVGSPGPILGWANTDPELILQAIRSDADGSEEPSLYSNGDPEPILVRGFFRDSLAANLPREIAFLHLDADLYESTRDVLTHCLPRLSPGALIVFDELHESDRWPGVGKAVRELCEPRGLRAQWLPELGRFAIRVPLDGGEAGPVVTSPGNPELTGRVPDRFGIPTGVEV